MKKKKIKLLVASMAVAAILVGGTLAWFQFHQNVPNHFTTGSIKTDIHEKFDPTAPEVTNMQPGVKIDKKVTVENVGNSPAFIRVKLTPVWDEKGTKGTPGYLSQTSAADAVDLNLASGWENNWVYNSKDGYYYYKTPVIPKKSTEELLDTVNLNKTFDLTGDYQDRGLTVNVTSDAVQITDGAWQDAWNKDNSLPESVTKELTKGQTTNTSKTTNQVNGSTSGTSSDHQKPLAK